MRWLAECSAGAVREALQAVAPELSGCSIEVEPSTDRVLAWHVRQALGDVLWRSEAGLPMAGRRTPSDWVDDLSARFSALGISP